MFDVHSDQMTGKVVVTDVKMPFGSMVVFMVKLALASIPAAIIVTVVMALVWVALTLAFAGIGIGMSR